MYLLAGPGGLTWRTTVLDHSAHINQSISISWAPTVCPVLGLVLCGHRAKSQHRPWPHSVETSERRATNPMKKRRMSVPPGSWNSGPGKQVRKEARKGRTCWSRWGWVEKGRDSGKEVQRVSGKMQRTLRKPACAVRGLISVMPAATT